MPVGNASVLEVYSSTSTTYGLPLIVIGSAFCGMLTSGQVMWLTSGTLGFSVRFCTCETSRMVSPGVLGLPMSAM